MKLKILSDMHIDCSPNMQHVNAVKEGDEDIVVCAGDISENPELSMKWLRGKFPNKPIVFVLGNHEFYNGLPMPSVRSGARECAKQYDITLLDNSTFQIDNIVFIGSTFWTNFRLYNNPDLVKELCAVGISDFFHIFSEPRFRLVPRDVEFEHCLARDFLEANLHKAYLSSAPIKSVIVTHFAPHEKSVAKRYEGDPYTPYFVSHYPWLVSLADLWIHGHTHNAFDYEAEGARVVANPGAYRYEKSGFNPEKIVEI